MSQEAAPAKAVQQRLAAGIFLKPTECAGWVGTKGGTSRGRQLQPQRCACSPFLLAAALMPSTPATLVSNDGLPNKMATTGTFLKWPWLPSSPQGRGARGRTKEARGRLDRNLPDAGLS